MTRHLWSLRLAFAALGVTAAVFPATIPVLAELAGVEHARLLPAVPLLFGGLLAGVLVSSLVPAALTRVTLAVGSSLQAVALVGFSATPEPTWFLVMAAVAGVGFGLVEASATALARVLAGPGTTALLTQLTLLVAGSAALTPLLVAVPRAPIPGLAALAVVPAAAGLLATGRWGDGAVSSAPPSAGPVPWVLVPAAVSLFAYVGAESVLSGWSSVLPERLLGLPSTVAALGTSVYWALMGAGRLAAWLLLRRNAPRRALLWLFLGTATIAAAAAAVVPGDGAALVLVGVACVGIAPSYAFLMGTALEQVTPQVAARVTGPLVAVGSLGGTLVPAILVTQGDRAVLVWVAGLLVLVLAAAAVRRARLDEAAPR